MKRGRGQGWKRIRRRSAAFWRAPLGPPPREGDALARAAAWFCAGVFLWFALPEPPGWTMPALLVPLLAPAAMKWPRLWPAPLMAAGLALMAAHVALRDTPLLPANVGRVTVLGQVRQARPYRPGRARIVLRVARIAGVKRRHWPERMRLTLRLREDAAEKLPLPGDVVRARALLLRLPRPVAPGAFDPGRALFMAGIGAVGYVNGGLEIVRSGCGGECGPWLTLKRRLERLRRAIAERLRAHMRERPAAALAVALLTGDRGALGPGLRERLRAAGLAHILAISGLHLALVAGAVFWLVRALLAAFPAIVLRWPVKKIAAVAAWLVAAAYLLLSGNSVATRRAFIMLSVATIALLADRPAISMRNLALAAWVILLLAPHEAASPGFQMSFLAVAGLVAAHEWLQWWRTRRVTPVPEGRSAAWRLSRWPLAVLLGIAFTTLIASLYTAPPAMWHFNRLPTHGLAGNLIALPVLSFMVMPAGLAALALMPFGLEGGPLWLMEKGLSLIAAAADHIARSGGWWRVAELSPPAALLMAAGLLWLALRNDRLRLLGVALLSLGLFWPHPPRPDLLVEERARLVAVRTPAGLAATPGRAGNFALRIWLARDGDTASPKRARARRGWTCDALVCRAEMKGRAVVYLKDVFRGRKARRGEAAREALARMARACGRAQVVVAAFPLRGMCREVAARGGVVIDRFDVWRNGAYALFVEDDGNLRLRSVRESLPGRPWAAAPLPRYRVREH